MRAHTHTHTHTLGIKKRSIETFDLLKITPDLNNSV